MNVKDRIPDLKGHWKLEVYDGDVERRPLTSDQKAENRVWRELGLVYRNGTWANLSKDYTSDIRKIMPVHVGEIISRPIDIYEGDNVVTTTGKGLLLDRLFALGGPPSQLTHMGVGASATAAAASDTQLNTTPDLRAFDALPTRASLVVTAIRTYATGEANINWQEIGLFNGGTNGTSVMFNRIAPIGAFNKTSSVAITATVTITQS